MAQLKRDDGEIIAYEARAGKAPGIIWLGGFKSDMTGTKASALDAFKTYVKLVPTAKDVALIKKRIANLSVH